MNLTELAGPRFQLALERLAAGHSFTYDGIGFRIDDEGSLECAVPSSWSIENVTAETANVDLDRAEQVLSQLGGHIEFVALTSGRRVRMILIYDYGNGAVDLCSRTEACLAWTPGMPRRR